VKHLDQPEMVLFQKKKTNFSPAQGQPLPHACTMLYVQSDLYRFMFPREEIYPWCLNSLKCSNWSPLEAEPLGAAPMGARRDFH